MGSVAHHVNANFPSGQENGLANLGHVLPRGLVDGGWQNHPWDGLSWVTSERGKFVLAEGINDIYFGMAVLVQYQDWGTLKLVSSGGMNMIGHVEMLDILVRGQLVRWKVGDRIFQVHVDGFHVGKMQNQLSVQLKQA